MVALESNLPALEYAKLTHVQKLAILLIMLGEESAAEILKTLNDPELEAVSAEMGRTQMVSQEVQADILREFAEVAIHAGTAIRGGVEFVRTALEKSVGVSRASNLVTRMSSGGSPGTLKQVADMDARQIYNLIKPEQPQTVALILSHLSPAKASRIIGMLAADVRGQVIERLATMAPIPIEVVERVAVLLSRKLGTARIRGLNQTGGTKAAASLLKALDKDVAQSLLASLEDRNAALSRAIRQKMFTFEDIASLDPTAIQRIMREVDNNDLALALKTAGEEMKAVFLGAISKRAAESVVEEMGFLGAVKAREIEAAQLRITEVVRNLEAAGEIELGDEPERSADETLG